jgi:hypothetical protein
VVLQLIIIIISYLGIKMKKTFNSSEIYKSFKSKGVLIGIALLLQMSPSILNSTDYELASISDQSKPFDLPVFQKDATTSTIKIIKSLIRNNEQKIVFRKNLSLKKNLQVLVLRYLMI